VMFVLFLLFVRTGLATDCGEACEQDLDCTRVRVICLMKEGENKTAIKALKEAYSAHPDESDLVHLMARAYLADGNGIWATRRLLEHVDTHPDDLETRAWATWVLVQDGDLVRGSMMLPESPNPKLGPQHARLALMRAGVHFFQQEPEKAQQWLRITKRETETLYPEDRAFQRSLRAQILGDPGNPVSARLWFTAGYATNAIETSPQSEGGEGSVGSVITQLDGVARHEPWTSQWARPRTEARFKIQVPWSAMDIAYVDLTARVGAELGLASGMRGRLFYSVELFGDNSSDTYTKAPRLFMEAHRGEVEVDLLPELQIFGGGGRRFYRRMDRTRTEADAGLAAIKGFKGGWNLTSIFAARWHHARHPDWTLVGGTALVRVATPLPKGAMLKARAMVLYDLFPEHALSRQDWTFRTQLGPWTPPIRGWRFGISYAFKSRWSSGEWDESNDPYSYSHPDHRVLLEVRGQGAWDAFGPRKARTSDHHVAFPYGLEEQGATGLDRVQDLLRQEDSARRGSSCVD
jgi:hypothetical protein